MYFLTSVNLYGRSLPSRRPTNTLQSTLLMLVFSVCVEVCVLRGGGGDGVGVVSMVVYPSILSYKQTVISTKRN